jgi:hypothetical protein
MTPTQILAAFVVVFRGLMMFQGASQTQKTEVVTVDSATHAPKLTMGGVDHPLMHGDQIEFSLPAGPASTDGSFDTRVPDLSAYVTSGNFPAGTDSPQNRGRVVVKLPTGTLSARDRFPHPAQFTKTDGSKEVRCMAENIRLTSTSVDPVTITISGPMRNQPATFVVPANSTVVVSNTPVAINSGTDPHFHEYTALLDTGGQLGGVAILLDQTCNSNGVPRNSKARPGTNGTPDGDCGPVDRP